MKRKGFLGLATLVPLFTVLPKKKAPAIGTLASDAEHLVGVVDGHNPDGTVRVRITGNAQVLLEQGLYDKAEVMRKWHES
jgi:hypothetical protein